METIRGKASLDLDLIGLQERLTNYNRISLDLGTGDGCYVYSLAERNPNRFVIGIDSCRENLREHSRVKLPNMLFVIANAQNLPRELNGLISHVTINFPWGSLLESLFIGDPGLISGLESISNSHASIGIRLNGGALNEIGWSLEAGANQIYDNLLRSGWHIDTPQAMNANALRSFPSTWAKRLAFGRDPRAMEISGHLTCKG